jgi:hypothetical protein
MQPLCLRGLNITGYDGVEKIQLPKDTVKYWALISTVMNIWFLSKGFEFISSLNEN